MKRVRVFIYLFIVAPLIHATLVRSLGSAGAKRVRCLLVTLNGQTDTTNIVKQHSREHREISWTEGYYTGYTGVITEQCPE